MESRLKRVRGYGGSNSNSYSQLNEDEEERENLLGRDTLVLGNPLTGILLFSTLWAPTW